MSKTGFTDQNKNPWVIEDNGDTFVAYPTAPALGVPAGRKLVAASSMQEAQDGIANLVDEYNETGKVIPRGGTLIVDAAAPVATAVREKGKSSAGGWMLVAALVFFILTEKKGRR